MRRTKRLSLLGAAILASTMGASASEPYGGSRATSERLILGGVVDFSAGHRDISSTDDGSGKSWEWAAGARFNIPIWSNMSIQLDGVSEFYSKLNDDEDPRRAAAAGVHISYRVPTMGLIGVFGGFGWSPLRDGDRYEMSFYGIEGQLYRDNWTYYLQAGVGDQRKGDTGEGFNDGWFVRGVARHFFTPDSKLEFEMAYAEAKPYIDNSDNGKFWSWGASFERKLFDLRNHPVYWNVSYRGTQYDATTEDDILTEHVFKVGLKVLFGATDLKHNDRYGATLDLPMMPVRANGVTELID